MSYDPNRMRRSRSIRIQPFLSGEYVINPWSDSITFATKTYTCDPCKDKGKESKFETAIELAQHLQEWHPELLRPKLDPAKPADLTEALLEAME